MTLMKNLRQHESVIAIDYDDWTDFPDIDKSDGEDESRDFNIVNRDLLFQMEIQIKFLFH